MTWSGFSASCYVNINGSQFSIEYIRGFFPLWKWKAWHVETTVYSVAFVARFHLSVCLFQTSNHEVYVQLLHSGHPKLNIEIWIWGDGLKRAGDVQGRICKCLQAVPIQLLSEGNLDLDLISNGTDQKYCLLRFHTAHHAVPNNSVVVLSLGALSSRP